MSITWGTTVNYNEQDTPVDVGGGLTITSGSNFGTGYVQFSVAGAQSTDVLRFTNPADVYANGAISVEAGLVYRGMGDGTRLKVGAVDPVLNGGNGQALRLNFDNATLPGTSPVVNGDFANGLNNWTPYTGHVDLGVTQIAGWTTPESSNYPGNTPGGNDNDLSGTRYGTYGNDATVSISGGRLLLQEPTLTTLRYGVVHGPAAYSDAFLATAGMVLKFDWQANYISDWFHVVGYLLNVDTGATIMALDAYGRTGSGLGTVSVPADGNYRFVFVSGTYDASGGTAAGASMYIDNIRVEAPALSPTVIESLALAISYESTSDNPGETATIQVTTRDIVGTIQTGTMTVDITPLNDAPILAGNVTLRPVLEDATTIAGSTVLNLFSSVFSDVDTGDTLAGVVVTGNSATASQGEWQYYDGTNWVAIGAVSAENGLVLAAGTSLRFVPAANYAGTPGALTVYGLDSSGGAVTSGDHMDTTVTTRLADLSDPTSVESVGLSTASRTIGITVVAVNDAPEVTTAPVTLTLVDTEDRDSATADLQTAPNATTGALTGSITLDDVESATAELELSLRGGTQTGSVWTVQGRYGELSLDTSTGTWTYVPNKWAAINALPQGATAAETFDIRVEDPDGGVGVQVLTVNLVGTNDLPVLSAAIDDQSFAGTGSWSFQIPAGTFTDAEGRGLTYFATVVAEDGTTVSTPVGTGDMAWLSFDEASRTFFGNPPPAFAGTTLTIKVEAFDDQGESASDLFDVTFASTVNEAPYVLNPVNHVGIAYDSATETQWTWEFPAQPDIGAVFADIDDTSLTYTAYTVASDGTRTAILGYHANPSFYFDVNNRRLGGTSLTSGDVVIELVATDSAGNTAVHSFNLDVYDPATVIVPAADANPAAIPASVDFVEGAGTWTAYLPAQAFQIDAPAGSVIQYEARVSDTESLPVWVSFSPYDGSVMGNAPDGTLDQTFQIRAVVMDSTGSVLVTSTWVDIAYSVTSPNDPLVLASAPADIAVDAGAAINYTFTLPFVDPDGTPDGTGTYNGITYEAFVLIDGAEVAVADLGLTLTVNSGASTLTLAGNPTGGRAFLDVIIRATEASSGQTSDAGFTISLTDPLAATAPNIGAYAANNEGAVGITGTATEGQTISATVPTDADGIVAGSISYQWQVQTAPGVWTDIGGARGQAKDLLLTQDEAGKDVRVQSFYADNGGFVENPISDAVTITNLNAAGSATISGSPTVGRTLSVSFADGDGTAGAAPSYSWEYFNGSAWVVIAGETAASYVVREVDANRQVRAVVTYVDDMGTTETVAAAGTTILVNTVPPSATDDSAEVTERSGLANGNPDPALSAPDYLLTGSVRLNDVDDDPVTDLQVTGLRQSGVEGEGTAATSVAGGFTIDGAYGTLTMLANGSWTYALDEEKAAVQALADADTLIETFNYTITDTDGLSDTAVLSITIRGADDDPELTGIPAATTVVEDVATVIDLSSLTFVELDSAAVWLRLSVAAGDLRATPSAGVVVTGSDTDTVTIRADNIGLMRAWLASGSVSYITDANVNDSIAGGPVATVTYAISDDGTNFRTLVATTDVNATPADDVTVVDLNGGVETNGTPAVAEAEVLTFRQTFAGGSLTFDGTTIYVAAHSTAREMAALFAAQSFANWTATDNGDGTVSLVAQGAGARANLDAWDFLDAAARPSPFVLTSSGMDETRIFYARGDAVKIAPEVTLSDIDSNVLSSAIIRLSGGDRDNLSGTAHETLTLTGAGNAAAAAAGLTVTVISGVGETSRIEITGTGTLAAYQTVLREILYSNSNPNAYSGTRTITVSVLDAEGDSSNGASFSIDNANDNISVGDRIFLNDADTGRIVAEVIDSTTFVASGPIADLTTGGSVSFVNASGLVPSSAVMRIASPITATVSLEVRWAPVVDLDGSSSDGRGHALTYVEASAATAIATADATLTDQEGTIRTLTAEITNPLDNTGGAMNERLVLSSNEMRAWLTSRGIAVSGEGTTSIVFHAASGVDSSTMQIALRALRYLDTDTSPDTRDARVIRVSTVDMDGNEGISADAAITITPINSAPSGIDSTIAVTEDLSYTFSSLDFGFSDPDGDIPANVLDAVRITTLPALGGGILRLNGVAVTTGQIVSVADIDAGRLTYLTTRNAAGSPGATFTFQVRDNGGTANGGTNLDPTAAIMTINITARNDAPVLTASSQSFGSITEDSVLTARQVASLFGENLAHLTDEDRPSPTGSEAAGSGIAIYETSHTGPGGGTWSFSTDSGATWTSVGTVSQGSALLLRGTDLIRFAGDGANASLASMRFYAWDGASGTAGQKVDANLRGGATAFSLVGDSASVTVTAVNDAPVIDLNGGAAGVNDNSVVFYARGPVVNLFSPDLTIADADVGDKVARVAVSLTGGAIDNMFGVTYETLSTTLTGPSTQAGATITITGNGTGPNGMVGATRLTLSGTSTAAHYADVLQTLRYGNANPNATHGARSIDISITDASTTQTGAAQTTSAVQTVNVHWGVVVDMNGQNVPDLDRILSYSEGDGSIRIAASDAELTIQDGNVTSVTMTLRSQPDGAAEYLRLDSIASIRALGLNVTHNGTEPSSSLVGATQITFTSASPAGLDSAVFQTAVRAVTYVNESEDPSAVQREVRVTTVDLDGHTGVPASTFINLTPVNDAPNIVALAAQGTLSETRLSSSLSGAHLSGVLAGSDVDSSTAFGIAGGVADVSRVGYDQSKVGTHGTLFINSVTGAYLYVPLSSAVEAMDDTETAIDSFSLTITDVEGLSASTPFTITLTGADDAPVLAAITAASIIDDPLSAATTDTGISGTANGTDVDGETLTYSLAGGTTVSITTDGVTYEQRVNDAGGLGHWLLSTDDGKYLFVKDAAAIDALKAADSTTIGVDIRVSDGDDALVAQRFSVNITGQNDAPVIAGLVAASITEQVPGTPAVETGLSGSVTTTDSEGDTVTLMLDTGVASTLAGYDEMIVTDYGTFHLNVSTGAYLFDPDDAAIDALDAGDTRTLTFAIDAEDADGAVGTASYVVTLTGANDAPVLVTAPNALVDGGTQFARAPLVLAFNETIQASGTGLIHIRDASGNIVETFDPARSPAVRISGGTLTVTPTVALAGNTAYYLTIDPGALNDTGTPPLSFAGLTTATDLNFTTSRLVSVSGIDISNDTGVSATDFVTNIASQTITATLSEALIAGERVLGSTNGGTSWSDLSAFVSGQDVVWTGANLGGGSVGSSAIRLVVEHVGGFRGDAATQGYVLDTVAPNRTVGSIRISDDSGISKSDFRTNVAAQTVNGTLSSALATGEQLLARVKGTDAWTDVTAFVTGKNVVWTGVTLAEGDQTIQFKVVDTAGNGTIASRAYTLDTGAVTTTVSGIDIANDTGSSASDFLTNTTSQQVTATLSQALAAGEYLFGSLNNGTTWANVTRFVTGSQLSWQSAALTTGTSAIKLKVVDAGGNEGSVATQAYTVDRDPPKMTFSSIQLSNDTGISATDFITSAAAQTVTGSLGRVLDTGEILQGSSDGGATWTAIGATGTAFSWAATLASGSSRLLFRVQDAAGNSSGTFARNYTLDTVAPTKTVSGIRLSEDSGVSASDFNTDVASQTIRATLSSSLSGDRLLGSTDGGVTWHDITSKVSNNNVVWSGATLDLGTSSIQMKVVDAAHNSGTVTTQAYTLVPFAPTNTATITALDSSKLEGSSGVTAFRFKVDLANAATSPVTLTWQAGDALSGASGASNSDFVRSRLPSGTVTVLAGDSSAIFTVSVQGDKLFEQNEEFSVSIRSPNPRTVIGGTAATATIQNDDALVGTAQRDTLIGSLAGERITGLAGDDTIMGRGGDDTILSGSGRDLLTGGDGADVFVFDVPAIVAYADVITDYTADVDRIGFLRSVFPTIGPLGTLSAASFTTGTAPTTAAHRVMYEQETGRLFFDADGTGRSPTQIVATLTGLPALSWDDIVIM